MVSIVFNGVSLSDREVYCDNCWYYGGDMQKANIIIDMYNVIDPI